jgi:hypothetical protein
MTTGNKTTQQQSMLDKLAAFRQEMQAIDAKYSTSEAYQKLQKDLSDEGKITGKRTGAKRGVARSAKQRYQDEEKKVSRRVEHWQRYVTMLQVKPRFNKKHDCNLVKFFLFKFLRAAGYSIIIQELNYQNSMMDTFAVAGNRAVEFEIKLSREDYLTDFSKMYWVGKNVNKHAVLAAGESQLISKFYFVVPENMVDVRECPDHCGLIWFKEMKASKLVPDAIEGKVVTFRVVKYPPLLHTRYIPALTWKTIAERVYAKYENIRDQYDQGIFLRTYKSVLNGKKSTNPVPGSKDDLQAGSASTDAC